jgi:excinuclease ABC subunit C
MTTEAFQKIQSTIPTEPGIYKYFDGDGNLIYVGKAKNIRKRVSSYFTAGRNNHKTTELVKRINRIEFTIVNSEQDAFLLENSLIKEFQPRFNIDLKDDKTYPYIVIRKEPFPRVFLTRRMIKDGSEYLGPFTSTGKVRELLTFIRQHIQIRTCKLNLSEKQIAKGKYKVCLEYQLGNCGGPCAGLQTEQDYDEGLQRLRSMLKGNLGPVMNHYKTEMRMLAADLQFEKAEVLKKKIEHLRNYDSSSAVVNPKLGDLDVFSIANGEELAYVNYLMVRNGTIVDTQTFTVKKKLDEDTREILQYAVLHLRKTFQSEAGEIVLPEQIDYIDPSVKCTVPRTGDKKKLLDLSLKNVDYFKGDIERRKRLHLEEESTDRSELLNEIKELLSLRETPVHIECFDNSNFQGSYPVSAMVCFINGFPSKKDYRHYNVQTVQGINDFATMKEVVYRRYRKLLDKGQSLPQLVIIDGGKGQLGAALESIEELGISGRMTLIGLAKNEEEIFFPGDTESLKLPYESTALKLIRQIRNEVHRFGITFHRKQRSKGTFRNELEDISGIGKKTAEELLRHFRSVKKIAVTSEAELSELIGPAKAKLVSAYFSKKP